MFPWCWFFGDDVINGLSVLLNDMLESNEGEFILDLEVDGIESSSMLSISCGFVEMLIELFLLCPSEMLYIIVDELFGLEHDGHVHASSLFPRLL